MVAGPPREERYQIEYGKPKTSDIKSAMICSVVTRTLPRDTKPACRFYDKKGLTPASYLLDRRKILAQVRKLLPRIKNGRKTSTRAIRRSKKTSSQENQKLDPRWDAPVSRAPHAPLTDRRPYWRHTLAVTKVRGSRRSTQHSPEALASETRNLPRSSRPSRPPPISIVASTWFCTKLTS
jgi:hypothetical protein